MVLQTTFFEFPKLESEAKEFNHVMSLINDRFSGAGQRIVNVETLPESSFLGFRLKAGGVRVWHSTEANG
jgi:hypothetical protein